MLKVFTTSNSKKTIAARQAMFSGGRGFESLKNKSHQQGANNELCYSISSMQGWRNEMEDAHCAFVEIPALEKWSFFGVFDGHGGTLCSEESSSKLFYL